MHLGCAASQDSCRIKINSDMISRLLERGLLGKLDGVPGFDSEVFGKRHRRASLKITVQFFDCVLPAITFIRNEPLEHRQDRRLAIRLRCIFHGARERRHLCELSFLCEISPDLGIRVYAFLLAPQNLEDESVAIEDRGIRLLSRTTPHRQKRSGVPPEGLKRPAPKASNGAEVRLQFLFVLDEGKQLLASAI